MCTCGIDYSLSIHTDNKATFVFGLTSISYTLSKGVCSCIGVSHSRTYVLVPVFQFIRLSLCLSVGSSNYDFTIRFFLRLFGPLDYSSRFFFICYLRFVVRKLRSYLCYVLQLTLRNSLFCQIILQSLLISFDEMLRNWVLVLGYWSFLWLSRQVIVFKR